MADIFLSYSREDQATARRFAAALEQEGFSVWWDQTLHSGDPYDRVTEQALKDARATVVLWSPHSVESRWVRAEATIADRHRKLLPVMIAECERPLMFELTQAAALSHWRGDRSDPQWRLFIDDVRRFVGREPHPPERAYETRKAPARAWRYVSIAIVAALIAGLAWKLSGSYTARLNGTGGKPASIAVLPFVDMTGSGADESLAEGLAEEISNWLAQIPGLLVVARTSAFEFRGANQDVRKVGRELGATHLLEGSVRRGGNTVRITVQLVATSDGYHLWSKTFDLPDSNALRIEDAVSRAVAEALNARLSTDTERRWKARKVEEPQAYALYLQARLEQRQRKPESNLRAMDLYRRAIARDPEFALPYVGLAEATLNSTSLNGRSLAAVAAEVTTLLDQADALSTDLPESIAVRGWLALEQFNLDDALALMQRAVELNPSDAGTQRRLGDLYEQMAQPRLAAERFDRAAELDPLDFLTHVSRCFSRQDLAEYTAAMAACARARDLDATNMWGPYATAWLEAGRGNLRAALRWLDTAATLAPGVTALQGERVNLLLTLRQFDAASGVVAALPESATVDREFMEASIALAKQDMEELSRRLKTLEGRTGEFGPAEWLALARLQLARGAGPAARNSLEQARRLPGWEAAGIARPDQVRFGYSAAVIIGGIELAVGNPSGALQAIDRLNSVLDAMEQGGAAGSGLYSLRAEVQALRGEPDQAMQSLQKAYAQGWRMSLSARTEPYLRSLRDRSDFRQLMARIDRANGLR